MKKNDGQPITHQLSYTILVTKGIYSHQASYSAYRFTQAVLEKGHRVRQLFFYQDGVYNCSSFTRTPENEMNLRERWEQLAERHGISYVACNTAALRRGIIDEAEASRQNIETHNLAEHCESSGLGQLMQAISESDRCIVFGG